MSNEKSNAGNIALKKSERELSMKNLNTKQNKSTIQFQAARSPWSSVSRKSKPTREDVMSRHLIYGRLLSYLENKQIRHRENGYKLPYILHEKTKAVLCDVHGFADSDIMKSESSILRDAEEMPDYEILCAVPSSLFYQYKIRGEADVIIDNRIVAIPNFIENALVCAALEQEFSRKGLLAVGGFILVSMRDDSGITHRAIRLDLDEKYCRRGYIVPIIRGGFIVGLEIYRYPADEKPFVLRSRVGGLQW